MILRILGEQMRKRCERKARVTRAGRSAKKSRLSPDPCSSCSAPRHTQKRPANYRVRKTLARNAEWRGFKWPPAKIATCVKRCCQRFLVKLPRKHTLTTQLQEILVDSARYHSCPKQGSAQVQYQFSRPPKGKGIKETRSVRFYHSWELMWKARIQVEALLSEMCETDI